ncbi:hypothetical protein VISI1226_21209 [Vibrio sinaloensis DSM 21326]|uniref:Uncharacterized protein n=1 Tax=Vibrio sinaloensis DSM 21326 TaxID=945550 RepID=E8MAI9_PHOS4|nr:hypothetical protein VISI1226_21209 [Vibrio sinaloensis DSM 21326]
MMAKLVVATDKARIKPIAFATVFVTEFFTLLNTYSPYNE